MNKQGQWGALLLIIFILVVSVSIWIGVKYWGLR